MVVCETLNLAARTTSHVARARLDAAGGAALVADWAPAVFIHYAVEPAALQPLIPFPLDLHERRAYVSVVAFVQRRLRPKVGGRVAELLSKPLANHPFCNVRTYVVVDGEPGIYFLAEWIPNRLAALLGPPLYGLPYRLGNLRYDIVTPTEIRGDVTQDPPRQLRTKNRDGSYLFPELPLENLGRSAGERPEQKIGTGAISFRGGAFRFRARAAVELAAADDDALAQFLIERYTAFTMRNGCTPMRFRIWHEPWLHVPLDVEVEDDSLLDATGDWRRHACIVCGHHSAGLRDVLIGRPCKLCRMRSPLARWTPLVVLPLTALALMPHVPAWAFMWAMAYAIFFGCKWATLLGAGNALRRATWTRILAYLFAWPGMDAAAFLGKRGTVARPTTRAWLAAIAKPAIGVILLFVVARHFADLPLLAGWIGMIGTILLLHFGVFHLLTLALRRTGINVTPIMNGPLLSRSVAEFWGTRWNLGFHHLANGLVFRPTVDRLGVAGALMLTFFASGVVHELVITLPARGGYGLPTLYFVLQGFGVLLERRIPRRRKLARRMFALAIVGLPAFILFPPPFVLNVFVPFMRAIEAM